MTTKNSTKEILFGADASTSTTGELNATDWRKIGRHLIVTVAGAAVSALFDVLAQQVIPGLHFGVLTATLTPVISTALETARRAVTDYLAKQDTQ